MPHQKRKKQLFKRNSSQKLHDGYNSIKEANQAKEFNKNTKARKPK